MNVLLRSGSKRTLALESRSHVLLFRYIKETRKCAIELVPKESFRGQPYKQLSKSNSRSHGFLGLIEMNGDIFICVITSKIKVATPLDGESVNKIVDVEFHSLTNDCWDFMDLNSNGYPNIDNESPLSHNDASQSDYPQRVPQHPCYELRKLLTDGSFFYSTNFDLTSTLQNRGIGKQRLSVDKFHTDYMWNDFMMEGILSYRENLSERQRRILDNDQFLTTVIRGFAQTQDAHVHGKPCQLTIISKQSWKRAGTRFNVRGVDDDGNVANFVETEIILNNTFNHQIYSFVQIRGSIPVFWEQDTALISPKVQITRSFQATQPIFEKHFENLKSKYGPIHCVNLLSATRSSEIELSNTYKKHFIAMNEKLKDQDSFFFTDFDFHVETSKTYADATKLLPLLQESFDEFGYFLYDCNSNRVVREQVGTFRTNCLDCLDRTNVIQQVISLKALTDYLHAQRINDLHSLKERHSTLWANHGDRISQIYTGTNALKSSFSRSGKMGFAGALSDATKSISRIYINNFVDKNKQQITDTLLGKISSQQQVLIYDPITDYVNSEMKRYESKFTSYEEINIFTGTFNIAGANNNKNLTDWLFPYDDFNPHMFVVAFQEVVELNASNILKSDGSVGQYWTKEVEKTIAKNTSENYVLLRSEFMSSILLLLFVREDMVPKVTRVEGKSKKTGLGGITANKGSVAIRLNVGSTSFCFVNSHLASGLSYTEERNNDFINAWNGIRFSRNAYIKDHDNIIWLGDLNYRITLPNDKTRFFIDKNDLKSLLERDQLSYQMMRIKEFKHFRESPIDFLPTYKFDKFSDQYDTSEKQRVPAWTDRIIFSGSHLKSIKYDIASVIKFSDHRPVYNIFRSRITNIDDEIKENIASKLRQTYTQDTKSKRIELNDASVSSAPSSASSASSSTITPNLIDFDTPLSTGATPPLPRRPVPPAYNAHDTTKMLIPGLTPVSIQNSVKSNTNSPASSMATSLSEDASAANANSTASPVFTVMAPTLSRSGSIPPPPPPRKAPTVELPQQTTSEQHKDVPSEHHKVAPIVPSKPPVLSQKFSHEQTASPRLEWSTMTPTKKL